VVGPPGVPAVHHDVTLVEQLTELLNHRVRGLARRDHHPHHTRRRKTLHHLLEAVDVSGVRVGGVAHHRVPGAADALSHVAAHPAETDETELHQDSFITT